jgi:hypothetical protein
MVGIYRQPTGENGWHRSWQGGWQRLAQLAVKNRHGWQGRFRVFGWLAVTFGSWQGVSSGFSGLRPDAPHDVTVDPDQVGRDQLLLIFRHARATAIFEFAPLRIGDVARDRWQ